MRRAAVSGEGMSRALVVLFAVATGQAVASNYLAQPLLDVISHEFAHLRAAWPGSSSRRRRWATLWG